MRYKLAACGCLTDEQGYLLLPPVCSAHQMVVECERTRTPLVATATQPEFHDIGDGLEADFTEKK
jgi:hypothetical protein